MIGVMIVDDQAPVRMGLALMLRHDPEVTVLLEAEDGKDALERLAHAEDIGAPLPDVVLMDVRMPGPARITARWPDTHVLVLTTYDEDDYAFGGLSAGASGFLLKDVRSRDLCQAVRAVASGDAVLTPRITHEVLERGVGRVDLDERSLELAARFRSLTQRERETCRLVADGLSNAEIAGRLFIEPASVKRSVTRILAKLGMRDRVQIAVGWYKAKMDG